MAETTQIRRYGKALQVYAKGGFPVGYGNLTQANRRAEILRAEGVACHVSPWHPFAVIIDAAEVA